MLQILVSGGSTSPSPTFESDGSRLTATETPAATATETPAVTATETPAVTDTETSAPVCVIIVCASHKIIISLL